MSCFQVAVLASGSKGNATVMRCEAGMVLVDAGISCRRIVQGMQKLGLRPENLDGVFITHEHIDHVKGLETFTKKYPVPIYASAGTWRGIKQTGTHAGRSAGAQFFHVARCAGSYRVFLPV